MTKEEILNLAEHFIRFFGDSSLDVIKMIRKSVFYRSIFEEVFEKVEDILKENIKIGSFTDYDTNEKAFSPEKLKILREKKIQKEINKTVNMFYNEINETLISPTTYSGDPNQYRFCPSRELNEKLNINEKAKEIIIEEFKKVGWYNVIFENNDGYRSVIFIVSINENINVNTYGK